MRIRFLLILCILGLSAFSSAEDQSPPGKVYAYYFHGNMRCSTCHKLELYSKEAIESNFRNELASGTLEFKAVNVEEAANRHFINDYQLYTKSLVLSLVKEGKEAKSINLVKIWELVGDKAQFLNYVKEEVARFLGEL